jgi:predicted small secreted protein
MMKLMALSLALATALPAAGCNTPQGQNAAGGAVIGGATGALLGGALTNRPGGALLGAVAGATAGAMVGSAAATPQDPGYAPPPRRCAEFYYDYYGNRVCRAYY